MKEETRIIEALEEYEVFEPIGTLEGYIGKMPTRTEMWKHGRI